MPAILVIDDDPTIRAFVRAVLVARGYHVQEASDGWAGLKLFRAEPPDLVLCDLYMPVREGIETIRDMRRLDKAVPIIAMSGRPPYMPDCLAVAKALGATAALSKPFSIAKLREVVTRLIPLQEEGASDPSTDGTARVLLAGESVV